jgi:BioD-like phosphotransacetylase family protein
VDPDLHFIRGILNLSSDDLPPTVLQLSSKTFLHRLQNPDAKSVYLTPLQEYIAHSKADVILLEGPGNLSEGHIFRLSLPDLAKQLEAPVILIARYHSILVLDTLLAAQQVLQGYLAGVLINDVAACYESTVQKEVKPFLESNGIPVLGILPSHRILRSLSVSELVKHLNAEVLCCGDRLDLLVEDFTVGAMNVNAALKYFRQSEHKAVITGGDRTDIQMAALETSTLCLILTGKLPLDLRIRARAEELGVPILSVNLDTFATIKQIEQIFGQVRLHEAIKVRCIQDLMSQNFDFTQLYTHLDLTQPLVSRRV